MGASITRGNIPSLLRPGLHAVFFDYHTYPDEWKDIFSINYSHKAVELEVEMKMLGLAQMKEEGASVFYDTMGQRNVTSYLHKYFAIGYIITRASILDNLYKERFPAATRSLKESLRQVKNIQGAAILNNGFSTDYPIGDLQPLFSRSHPVENGLVANTFPIPTQLNETSLQDAIIGTQIFRNASGYLCINKPIKLHVPPQLQFTADVLLGSRFRPGTANNDINAIHNMGIIRDGYRVNNYLTSPSAWFIQTDNANGFKYFEREKLDIDMFTDIDTDNYKVRAMERYSFGVSDFRATFGSPGL